MRLIRTFARALVIVGGLAVSATIAHAGGGGFGEGPFGNTFLTDCYKAVEGANAPYTMDVTDQFGNRQSIKVGQAQFVCVLSGAWQRTEGSNSPALNPALDPASINAAQCYNVNMPGDQGAGTVATVTDLFSTQTNVKIQKLSLLCVPATLE
jgi:hypothetical protein